MDKKSNVNPNTDWSLKLPATQAGAPSTDARALATRASFLTSATVLGPSLAIGSMVDRFRLEALVGRGAMGEVWKAFDPRRNGPVVVKVLPANLRDNPGELARIKHSFERVAKLHHSHICPVVDVIENEPTIGNFLVMHFIDGVTLAVYYWDYLRKHGGFPLTEMIRVLKPIAEALDHAHRHGVIHRDIKPQNIMVARDGSHPQLVDFGLAAEVRNSMSRVGSQFQAPTDLCGTYPYMAPEQWRCRPQDARTDQYALAAVAYELLTGRTPFESADRDILRDAVLAEPIPLAAGQPNHVQVALMRGMAKIPVDRFDNCLALFKAIETPTLTPRPTQLAAKAGLTSHSSAGANAHGASGSGAAPPFNGQNAVRQWITGRSSAIVALAALLLVSAIAWRFWPPHRPAAPEIPVAAPMAKNPAATPEENPVEAKKDGAKQNADVPEQVLAQLKNEPPVAALPPVKLALLSDVQKKQMTMDLQDRIKAARRDLDFWRVKLQAPFPDMPAADARKLNGRWTAALNDLEAFHSEYDQLAKKVDLAPPAAIADYDDLKDRITRVAATKIQERDLPELLKEVQTLNDDVEARARQARTKYENRLTEFAGKLKRAGQEAADLMESAYAKGYELPKAYGGDEHARLLKLRVQMQEYADALILLNNELRGRRKLTPEQLDNLAERLQKAQGEFGRPEHIRKEAVLLVKEVETAVKAAKAVFERRKELLVTAHQEAQWFLCTDRQGKALYVSDFARRGELTTDGKAPWIFDGKQHATYANYRDEPRYQRFMTFKLKYVDGGGNVQELQILDGSQDTAVRNYLQNKVRADSAKFARLAGPLRQQFVPYGDADLDKIAAKRQEMIKALASVLNQRVPGLDLLEEEVSITWRIAAGDQKEVTLANTFGEFRIEVIRPLTLPPGLLGHADARYRAAIDQVAAIFHTP